MDYPKGETKKLPTGKMKMNLPGNGEVVTNYGQSGKVYKGQNAKDFADDVQSGLMGGTAGKASKL